MVEGAVAVVVEGGPIPPEVVNSIPFPECSSTSGYFMRAK